MGLPRLVRFFAVCAAAILTSCAQSAGQGQPASAVPRSRWHEAAVDKDKAMHLALAFEVAKRGGAWDCGGPDNIQLFADRGGWYWSVPVVIHHDYAKEGTIALPTLGQGFYFIYVDAQDGRILTKDPGPRL